MQPKPDDIVTDHNDRSSPACPLCGEHFLSLAPGPYGAALYRCASCNVVCRPVWELDRAADVAAQLSAFGASYVESRRSIAFWLRLDAANTLRRIGRYMPAPAKLLEFGCATGDLCSVAGNVGYEAHGVELSAAAARFAAAEHGVRVVAACMEDLEVDSVYDVVVGIHTFEHFADPHHALACIWRVLRPGGVVYIEVPSVQSWAVRLSGERAGIFTDEHLFFHTERSLSRFLSRAGFEVLSVSTTEGYPGLFNFVLGRTGFWRMAKALTVAMRARRPQASGDVGSRSVNQVGVPDGRVRGSEGTIDAARFLVTTVAYLMGIALSPLRWCLGVAGLGGNLVVVARRPGSGSLGGGIG